MDRHTLAVSQSQGNATADYPPSSPLAPNPIFPAQSQAPRLFSYVYLQRLSGFIIPSLTLVQAVHLRTAACCVPPATVKTPPISGPSCVSSGVKWFRGYKYDTAHKQVLGYKGLHVAHLALAVRLGLHTVLLIGALCVGERDICKHGSALTPLTVSLHELVIYGGIIIAEGKKKKNCSVIR